ncbi:MAG: hypothetical protein GY754_38030 [bacterium]|nr:hypothetical protein [bacterium]
MTKNLKLILAASIIGEVILVLFIGCMKCSNNITQVLQMVPETEKNLNMFMTAKTTSQDCLNEAIAQNKWYYSIPEFNAFETFLERCLENAIPVKETCSDIHSCDSITKLLTWTVGYCYEKGIKGFQGCISISSEIMNYCKK